MIEFRKEYFADERDDNLNEIGKPTQRQDVARPCHRAARPIYDDHLFDGLLHIRCVRCAAPSRPHPPHRHRRGRAHAGRGAHPHRARRAAEPQHAAVACSTSASTTSRCSPTRRSATGASPSPPSSPRPSARRATRWPRSRVDWEELPHVLDVEEAIKPGAPAVNDIYPGNLFVYHGKYDHQKLRFGDVEAAFATGRPRRRGPLPDVADRAGADRDLRRHRRARDQRPLRRLHLDPGAVLLARHHRRSC